MVFIGYRIKGIDEGRVPIGYNPNDGGMPFEVYLELEWSIGDLDGSLKDYIDLNADLMSLWVDKFKQEVDTWLQEDDDIVLPDSIHPNIEYDHAENRCLRVEGITLDDIEGIIEPLKGFVVRINGYIEDELDKRLKFKRHVEHINSKYFETEEDKPTEKKVKTLWT